MYFRSVERKKAAYDDAQSVRATMGQTTGL